MKTFTIVPFVLCFAVVVAQKLSNVDRKIDLSTHVVTIVESIRLDEAGGISELKHGIDPNIASNLAYFKAEQRHDKKKTSALSIKRTGDQFVISLGGKKTGLLVIEVTTVLYHVLEPFPKKIRQSQSQFFRFTSNLYTTSPYICDKQTTTVVTPGNKLESFTKTKPFTQRDSNIVYGPYENVPANGEAELIVHFENNGLFLTVTELQRSVEVSMWGNIAVEDTYDILHTGAKLDGAFSRYDYQIKQDGHSAVKGFESLIPAGAKHIYYRDDIGNISTSEIKSSLDYTEIAIEPRFPLFGGWKTHYTLGYSVPSYQFLYNKGNHFVLQMPLLDQIYEKQFVADMTLRVVLPELASDIKFHGPIGLNFKRLPDETFATYMDTHGRPVVVIQAKNLVEQHITDYQLEFKFSRVTMVREPFMVFVLFVVLFLSLIVYVRIDFAIGRDVAAENRLKLDSWIETAVSNWEQFIGHSARVTSACNDLKRSKNVDAFHSARSKLQASMQQSIDNITKLVANCRELKLTSHNASLEKLNELIKLSAEFQKLFTSEFAAAEKLVAGKMSKDQYISSEANDTTHKQTLLKRAATIRQKISC